MAVAIASQSKLSKVCRTSRRTVSVRAQAPKANFAGLKNKIATAALTLPAMIVSSPAFALVDDRLNGDGTGKPLGINDPVLGFVMGGVFLTMWAIWFNGQKDLGDFEDDDAGLSL